MHKMIGVLRGGKHLLTPEQVSMVEDPNFENTMRHAEQDEDAKAFLMIEALKGISLDPRTGERPECFCKQYGEVISFNIRFYGWTNFIGLIDLPAGSGRAKQLIGAIEANLKSRMFKAAKMHRRLNARRGRLHEQVVKRAHQAYLSVRMESPDGRFTSAEHKERADEAYERVFAPRMAVVDDRIRRVGSSATPEFQGAFTEAVAKFLYWHLPFTASKGAIQ